VGDCAVATKPICDAETNACVPCTADEQCVASGPSVCMSHVDGHCATDAETIYVGSSGTATCSDSAQSAGTARVPYCTAQSGVLAARMKGKSLVVMSGALVGGFSGITLSSPLTVVGKNAVITPEASSDGISITSGELYLRGVKMVGSAAGKTRIGINAQATAGATLVLRLDGCAVTDNPGGGILLDGAGFDIRNTVISGNGPGQTAGGAIIGGILIDSLAASGPANLTRVSITDNVPVGLSCAASIQGSGVLASGNTVIDILDSCDILPCSPAGATCGAQP
jgi:hypothetical protein